MTVKVDRYRYLKSLSGELTVQADRVRNLIGDRHWLHDGHHKEALLVHLLQRHVPTGIRVARGFIVSSYDQDLVSREQDALLLDTHREAPLFSQEGLAIALPSAVVGAISVKTTLNRRTIADSIDTLRTARQVCGDQPPSGPIWCGAFFFGLDSEIGAPTDIYAHTVEALKAASLGQPSPAIAAPDFLATAEDLAFRFDRQFRPSSEMSPLVRIRGFQCAGVATAVFLSDLLSHLATGRPSAVNSLADLVDNNIVTPLDPADVTAA